MAQPTPIAAIDEFSPEVLEERRTDHLEGRHIKPQNG
jgi:hypothetical protein